MTIDKDRAIVTQVAAKIAADLVLKEAPTAAKLGEFALLFTEIKDILIEEIFGSASAPIADVVALVRENFAGSEEVVATLVGAVTVRGTQHGDLPAWLVKACKRDGVSQVWDNRDQANVANRRPWFKQVAAEGADAKGYWPPRK